MADSALVLNEEEWHDLEQMAHIFLLTTIWAERKSRNGKEPEETVKRRRRLARRIVRACREGGG